MPHDAAANRAAIVMLERAIDFDPTYAPAWGALGLRCYFDYQYSTGGDAMYQRSNAALERALTLDPNLTSAAAQLIANRVEKGDLTQAYVDAADLLKRQPGNAAAWMVLVECALHAGDRRAAEEAFLAVLALQPAEKRGELEHWYSGLAK